MIDQIKIGNFLKELRKERNLTQQQVAEKFNVATRTVSRWETGNNMPDLSILVEIADFYDVDIREIFNGERKSEKMDKEMKDTLKQVAEYGEEEKNKLKKKIIDNNGAAIMFMLIAIIFEETNGFNFIPMEKCHNLTEFAYGAVTAILVLNMMYLSGVLDKIRNWKLSKFNKAE